MTDTLNALRAVLIEALELRQRPDDLQEALQALQRLRDDARIMAGGLSLVPMMNFRLLETKYLIDISNLASLAYIRETSAEIEIGAAQTQASVLAWPKIRTLRGGRRSSSYPGIPATVLPSMSITPGVCCLPRR